LSQRIKAWRGDSSTFVEVPLSKRSISRTEAYKQIFRLAALVKPNAISGKTTVGFCFEDPVNWILATIAAQVAGAIAVPIPREFTESQISSFIPHLDLVFTDSHRAAVKFSSLLGKASKIEVKEFNGLVLHLITGEATQSSRLSLPSSAVGVIHTSGSTDNPKGVVISEDGLWSVLLSMTERLAPIGNVRYASVLPMSLLLEQILGIYIPLFSGGKVAVLPSTIPCYTGTQPDLEPYLATIKESRANFSMVPPSFLAELTNRSAASTLSPRDQLGNKLQVLATGGAPIEYSTLQFLHESGLEVFQGYGLSENTSVVAWTYPGPNAIGSVGRPLKHNEVRINDGQIEVRGGSVFLGYVSRGEFSLKDEPWLKTGDNGFFDDEGCLHITGRDSNLIVLSSGRNVSPEWVEGKFKSIPSIKEILLIGHGRPFLSALVLVNKGFECSEALRAVRRCADEIESDLPEFSRVQAFRTLPFENSYYSVSGRVLRKQVIEKHKDVIDEIYSSIKG
ncbi:MAG: AMP-binding protein, partial [Pseudobdellovibrionaceae bacterium]